MMEFARRWALAAVAAVAAGCGVQTPADSFGEIAFAPSRPSVPVAGTATPYTGSDPLVLEAQSRYLTGLDLHRKLVLRSCGGTGGVCHNQKEYPDLHTAATFAAAVGAPCNVQPGSWSTVFDRCEQRGDRFRFAGDTFREIEVGWVEQVKGEPVDFGALGQRPTASSAGLHLVLHDPLPADVTEGYRTGVFVRTFVAGGNVEEIAFTSYETRWWILEGRTHLFGEVRNYQADEITALMASGIAQGDRNRNGVYGARTGRTVPLINPGFPEQSYLVARLRGHMEGERVPGSRMPLANQPPSVPDMVALMCFIERLQQDPAQRDTSGPIDYGNCSYTADPQALSLVGNGVTWSTRVRPILEANCGGCHGGATPQAGLNLLAADAWQRLQGPSTQKPELKLVQSGQPEKSYLWLKLSGDGSILGSRMPINPQTGGGQLPQDALDAIQTWIVAGALQD
ncbi:MAG TPA: hypothetical protein VE549_13155 [Myxococcaceae bacterium]|nr:hypothetical protein [Myxococcaceae bacterium]